MEKGGNTEIVDRFVTAFEDRDTDAALAFLDPQVELRPVRAQLEGTIYEGHEGYRRVVSDFDQDWEDLRLIRDEVRESGDFVVSIGHLTARGRVSGVELDVPLTLLYEVRGGKLVRIESYPDSDDALRAAGIED